MVDLDLSYDLLVLNNADRANSFNFSFSTDGGASFTNVPALDFTSPETADASPIIQTMMQSTTLIGVNLADGDCIILQWTGDDVSGGGSRDEFGLDNITICPASSCPDFSNVATPMVGVINSTCTMAGGTPSGGSFTAPTASCPAGSTLEYSTNGTTWSTTLPTYNQTMAMTVSTRCNCDIDNTMSSSIASVSSMPGTCPNLQLSIPTTCTSPLVDFTGFDGSGFTATPTAGQLSSTDWNFTGFSDGYTSGAVSYTHLTLPTKA